MSTASVECWKCDECGWRWIKAETWPERCASSKCRKRSWNKNGGSGERQTQSTSGGRAIDVQVSSPASPVKSDLEALRAICEGKPMDDADRHHAETCGCEALGGVCDKVSHDQTDYSPRCVVCDSPMRDVKGKWACQDVSCGKYGVEQKVR
jgi:hypothetical protein